MSKAIRLADAFGAPGAPSALTQWFHARLNDAAEGFSALSESLRPRRSVVFAEQADGTFVSPVGVARLDGAGVTFPGPATARALRGTQVEFRLAPHRCVFRELELPARASEFLEGVVRAQIDRLTPWRADEAAFGCAAPVPHGAGRILVTVAATRLAPLATLLDIGADAVRVTIARQADTTPITLLARRAGASSRRQFWRRALIGVLGVSLLSGLAALAADWTLGANLREQSDRLTASLAEQRATMLRHSHAGENPAEQALDARKRAVPAAVVVLEALSRAIPDDAYLTQWQLSGDKLEISGLATDAAALIRLIELSPHFSQATFSAPTTRGGQDRESFRIEAHVSPLNAISP